MSFRAFGKQIIQIVARLALGNSRLRPLFFRSNLKNMLTINNARLSRNLFVRVVQRTVRTQNLFRPFSTALHFRSTLPDRNTFHTNRPRRLIRVEKQRFAFLDHIKNLFSTNQRYNASLVSEKYPQGLDNYEIGCFIAVGCNAAVYELRSKNDVENTKTNFPLALKIMFVYEFGLPERVIVNDMINELVPLANIPENLKYGKMGFKPLGKNHPNVIKLHTAFVERFPNVDFLERAQLFFPEALPSADIFGSTINEPKTLFIVMKRYHCTLRDYLMTHKRNYWSGKVLFGQLLEALVFLYENNISHRDVKSDNILLDFDSEQEIPHLVLSDFGSARTSSFILNYDDEFADLGGNLSLRAPEIRRAKIGTVLDYHLADTWAAGTIAYEIFTRMNPFYSKLSSETYTEDDLPELPKRVNSAVKSVVYRMLKIDPSERPLPHTASAVVTLSLFRFGNEVASIMKNCGVALELCASNLKFSGNQILDKVGVHLNSKMDEIIGLFASETITAKLITPSIISRSELQLRATFLARVNRQQVWDSLEYFIDANSFENSSTISSGIEGLPIN